MLWAILSITVPLQEKQPETNGLNNSLSKKEEIETRFLLSRSGISSAELLCVASDSGEKGKKHIDQRDLQLRKKKSSLVKLYFEKVEAGSIRGCCSV